MSVKAASDRTPRLLVVDDDDRLRRLLVATLSKKGFWVDQAANTQQAQEQRHLQHYDLLVVDVMMPGETGTAYVKRLRQQGDMIPVVLLTALGDTPDRIEGLQAGADDYLAKPFDPQELALRLHAILRRLPAPVIVEKTVLFGDFYFDVGHRQLWKKENRIPLTSAETDLLALLAATPGQTVHRRPLAQLVGNETDSRAVDVTVTRLRRKLENNPRAPLYLQTVRGEGYVLMAIPVSK
jgi:two-component system, OmpR family, phosphate regulon response regulator OmpR